MFQTTNQYRYYTVDTVIKPEINNPKQENPTTKSDRATRSFLRILSQSNWHWVYDR